MKFHMVGRPQQFQSVVVTCHDEVMVELLNKVDNFRCTVEDIVKERTGSSSFSFGYMFASGAKLKPCSKRHTFAIYGYSSDGHDTLAAIQELKMLMALRKAQQEHNMLAAMLKHEPGQVVIK